MKYILYIILALPLKSIGQNDSIIVEQTHPTLGTVQWKLFVKKTQGWLANWADSTKQNIYAALMNRPTLARVGDSLEAVRADINTKQPAGSYLMAADIAGKANIASPSLTGNVTTTGSFGYATTAGGTVTQTGNKSNSVTLNKICGQITMHNAALAAGAEVAFTLNNNTIISTDVVIVNIQSVGTAGSYLVAVGAVANGSCSITISNVSTGSLSQAPVLNFVVIKSVNN